MNIATSALYTGFISTSIRGEHQETAGNRCIAGGRFCPVPVREAEKTVPVPSGILNDPFPASGHGGVHRADPGRDIHIRKEAQWYE